MAGPTPEFWQERFESGQTPWDRGVVHAQLQQWFDAGRLRPGRVLVPGCGSGYEVESLARLGFTVTGLDYAPAAIARAQARVDALPEAMRARCTLVCADALHWMPDAPYDAVYEQTCLCALYPDLWVDYAAQVHRWLRPGGSLFALFVQAQRPGAAEGQIQGPPYHCDIHGMRALFPAPRWVWPKPPYPRLAHPAGMAELAVELVRA
jgi:SAM-dependent methyltransferase